ncbi:NAD(P)H-dependent oxidoreductase [Flammeovirga aprica]|uniref:NAD(P)H-dependent oxidoreductase n=1 Tax=Flammeovirga aprica JL-4 TaxID=694437 RepID=A0A7X9RY64_9BACT|nr:NAD(P)H-dependent oxidoreductase [Flammeovirga aprica]NME70779.1 NAD(P)H-dependent oxidoreductase [Flammeovirga aprica JL-4]
MKNILIINAAHPFAHSGGRFNKTLAEFTVNYYSDKEDIEVRKVQIGDEYDPEAEVKNFQWADVIIYHVPIWWFQVPFGFKEYIDKVFTAGHQNGIYMSDGRSRKNPAINYGTGGMLHGKKYVLTTSWNAPSTAFTMEGEFFQERSVDDGVMFGFHRMNAFTGMELINTHHFYDMEKNADVPLELEKYNDFLKQLAI